MLDNLFSVFERRDAFKLLVMHANKVHPFFGPRADRLLEAFGVWVELDRVHIHRVDLDRSLDRADENGRLYAANNDALRDGPVDEVDALEVELEHGLALDGHSRP